MTMKSLMTDTAIKYQKIHTHQPVLIVTPIGKSYKGIILSPSPLQSLVRYNEEGIIKETRIANKKLVPVRLKSHI
jgi:hypothetical protein